jgi:hypothetical protein
MGRRQPEASMTLPQSVATLLTPHVTLEVESSDRMYLNVYVPHLHQELGVVGFFRRHRGQPIASSALMEPMTTAFVAALERCAKQQGVPLIPVATGQRKDDLALARLAVFPHDEGVVFIGKAQEQVSVVRTERRAPPETGRPYAWIVRSTALVNQYYCDCLDREFGPFVLKFCSSFPYNATLCLNGHEYLKRQLTTAGSAFEPLDTGLRSCADPVRMQAIADGLGAPQIEALRRRWLARLPHPFPAADTTAGYRYALSILQLEGALTPVRDAPRTGRVFFEEVIRENLDLGRPDQVQLIFDRQVTTRTPGPFRTRVITDGVTPSLHVDYKQTRIKPYHKEGQALRTETTINDTRDFAIGQRRHNRPAGRASGFQANRRLLDVQRCSHDCTLGAAAFRQVTQPIVVAEQRAAALPGSAARVQALFNALVMVCLRPSGFANRDLRQYLAPWLGLEPSQLTAGRMTDDLRRLRLHGLMERLPGTHRYRVTLEGLRVALFFTPTYARLLRPGLARLAPAAPPGDAARRPYFDDLEAAIDRWVEQARLAA